MRGALLVPIATLVLVGSCRRPAPDPWAYKSRPNYEPPRPCPRRELIADCPAGTRAGMSVSESLNELEGREVVVSGIPTVIGFGTMLQCHPGTCCNHGVGQILLCGGIPSPETDCTVSVVFGSCSGDSCRWCCSHNIEERPLVAKGRLRRRPSEFPGLGVIENWSGPRIDMFELENASFCYRGGLDTIDR